MKKIPLWNGFYHQWVKNPHRISVYGSRFNYQNNDWKHQQILKLGNDHLPLNADNAIYKCGYTLLSKPSCFWGIGRSDYHQISAKRDHPTSTEVKKRITIDVKDLLFSGNHERIKENDQICLLINGFHFEAENNKAGWQFGGFGITLSNPKWTSNTTLSFDLILRFRPASAKEISEHGNKGWDGSPWDASMLCTHNVSVDYLIFSAPESQLNGVTNFHDLTVKKKRFTNKKVPLKYALKNKNAHAFLGFSGFDFLLKDRKTNQGRYTRILSLMLDKSVHTSASIESVLKVKFSNRGIIPFSWDLQSNTTIQKFELDAFPSYNNTTEGLLEAHKDTFSYKENRVCMEKSVLV